MRGGYTNTPDPQFPEPNPPIDQVATQGLGATNKPAWINTGWRLIRVDHIACVRRSEVWPEVIDIVTLHDRAGDAVSVCFTNEGVRDREYSRIVEILDNSGAGGVRHLSGISEAGPTLYRLNGTTCQVDATSEDSAQ